MLISNRLILFEKVIFLTNSFSDALFSGHKIKIRTIILFLINKYLKHRKNDDYLFALMILAGNIDVFDLSAKKFEFQPAGTIVLGAIQELLW